MYTPYDISLEKYAEKILIHRGIFISLHVITFRWHLSSMYDKKYAFF